MSTIQAVAIKHASSASNNIVLNTDGSSNVASMNMSGSLTVGTTSTLTGATTINGALTVNNSVSYLYSSVSVNPAPALDGSTSAKAAPSAKYIQEVCKITTDGVYWINLPTVGATQIYCIMDPTCAGGGWMMAMKAANTGTTFSYSSGYWSNTSTLNTTAYNRNSGDAKFDTFNYFLATDWLAIWPDITNGGDVSGGFGGWTWVENNVTGNSESPRVFFGRSIQITKASNGVVYSGTNPAPTALAKYGNQWSMSSGFQWYGLNYTGNASARVRWGWATNNESDQGSNDINGGIGMDYSSFSAGDKINCCASITGINRQARVEWYVR